MTPKRDSYWGIRHVVWPTALMLYVAGCSSSAPSPSTTTLDSTSEAAQSDVHTVTKITEHDVSTSSPTTNGGLPRLLDLGAGKCIPCKMMAPILEELEQEYAGVFDVEFIDVWQHPEEAKKHGVETIPTQIFFDASGKEIFRHVGFFSKEDILAKWQGFGVELKESRTPNK